MNRIDGEVDICSCVYLQQHILWLAFLFLLAVASKGARALYKFAFSLDHIHGPEVTLNTGACVQGLLGVTSKTADYISKASE